MEGLAFKLCYARNADLVHEIAPISSLRGATPSSSGNIATHENEDTVTSEKLWMSESISNEHLPFLDREP